MKKIKVLIVAGEMNVGGIENQLMHLLRNVDKEKFQVDYTSTMPDAYYRREIEELGGKFILIPHMSHSNPLPYCKALYRTMKEGQYDVVHSHELFHSGIVLAVAKIAGVPSRIAHAHNWQDHDGVNAKRSAVRQIYNVVMRAVINTCATARMSCSTLAGKFVYGEKALKSSNYHLVFNSVDTSKFLEQYDREETGEFCDGWCNVLQVGRVTRVKNQKFLTEVAAEFKRRGKNVRILCAGSGDEEYISEIQTAIEANGLQEHIRLLGVRSDIDVLMRKAAAFVLPSKYEGMPLVHIEAQASGLPCVVADTYSHEVDFEIGKVQWLPLNGDAAQWADALEQAIASGRAEKAEVVRVVQEKRFDSKMFAQTLCSVYEKGFRHD